MPLAAFLPVDSLDQIAALPHRGHVILVRSWDMLHRAIIRDAVNTVVLDPSADGSMNIDAVASVLVNHPSIALVAYVPMSEPNLRATLQLSRLGVSRILLHPRDKFHLWEAAERISATRLSRDFLAFIGISQVRLPQPVARAIQDLFDRPRRYETASDIAAQARCSVKRLYRNCEVAHLGNPKKLLIAAKMLQGYGYLQMPGYPVSEVSARLGYSDPRIFGSHTRAVFGCTPSSLKVESNREEVVRHLLDWYCKPHQRPERGP